MAKAKKKVARKSAKKSKSKPKRTAGTKTTKKTKKRAKKKRKVSTIAALGDEMVRITYELVKSSDVSVRSLVFGNTEVDLDDDLDASDADKFATRNNKYYDSIRRNGEVNVFVNADGNAGGYWTLTVNVDGNAMSDNPIEEDVRTNGRADHDQPHS